MEPVFVFVFLLVFFVFCFFVFFFYFFIYPVRMCVSHLEKKVIGFLRRYGPLGRYNLRFLGQKLFSDTFILFRGFRWVILIVQFENLADR